MKKIFVLLLLLPFISIGQDYWQQEVNYKINVELNDKTHTLSGYEEFEYVNNSPDQLKRLYIHIWPNAYKNRHTALACQLYGHKDQSLTFADEKDKGHIDSLDFKINQENVHWHFHHHEDIVIIELNTPLQSGESLTVSTPFRVKIPSGEISRLGHIGQSYQITQWYPKPAVYDQNGWHAMPYLNQGEFYSEYGSFDVSITLPENYVVGATGDLQTASEIEFLNEKAAISPSPEKRNNSVKFAKQSTTSFPKSSDQLKTIRFTQDNVHDFAWFADKRYLVSKGEVELPHSKRKVTTWAMFTPKNEALWSKANEYLNDGIYYYSLWNGDYPYNQVTAVDGTISAGGGMEYPNVTVIGNAGSHRELETVIVHEVGHNWFYGQLGSNERVHGWMDEGLNTLNEVRYMQTKYPDNTMFSDMILNGSFHFNDLDHHDLADISYRLIAGLGEDQPIETHSNDFTPANYGIIMYQKTSLVFYYLKGYLGEKLFDQCMRAYYEQWEFKHPQPEDLRSTLERVSKKDLGWLFEDLIKTTNHVDYKISRVNRKTGEVTVKNVGQVDGPIEVSALSDGKIVEKKWIEPGNKKSKIVFDQEFDAIQIDPERDIPEINRQNNNWKSKGLFGKVERPSFEFLFGDSEQSRTNIFWSPIVGGNAYDKFMLGFGIHNYGAPFNKVNYLLMPYYSFGRQMASGMGEISVSNLPKQHLKKSTVGLWLKSFKHDTIGAKNESYFIAIGPYWSAKIGNRRFDTPFTHNIRIQSIYRKDQFGPRHTEHAGAYVSYNLQFKKPDHVVNLQLRNDYLTNTNSRDEIARGLLEAKYKYRYKKRGTKSWIHLRLFFGKYYINNFSTNANRYQYSMSLAGTDGRQDLFVDQYYFGRNATHGMWSQQRNEDMGGFKSTSTFGTTTDLISTANLYIQLPIPTGLIGVFADYGVFVNDLGETKQAINTGLAIRAGDYFGIYFPVWMNQEMDESYPSLNYAERIRFTLKFNLLRDKINLTGLL